MTALAGGAVAVDTRPLIAHIVFRFDYGGLENGIVNLVNGLPQDEFRHAIIALTDASGFRLRISRPNVAVYSLGKRPGHDLRMYWRLLRLLRRLRPTVVHTRNFGTLDCAPIAWCAGVPLRVHGEHGWDINDPNGTVRKYQVLRRLLAGWITRWLTVSDELRVWLTQTCHIDSARVRRIYNGVDTDRFRPGMRASGGRGRVFVVGTVMRLEPIKDPLNVVCAFVQARRAAQPIGIDLRLTIVGDGSLRGAVQAALDQAGEAAAVTLLGSRDDVAALLPTLDLFVLGSRREGVSNTVLEAMAAGLAVVATNTGGNPEIVEHEVTGTLVPVGDSGALATAILRYASNPALREEHAAAARARALSRFSLQRMLQDYAEFYRALVRGSIEVV